MRNGSAGDGHAVLTTPTAVTHDLLGRYLSTGNLFKIALAASGVLLALGVVGLVLRLSDGVSDPTKWGYYAAAFAFILSTAQAAPMVAFATKIVKSHWRRPISRAAELFAVVGLFNLLLFIPLLWVLPSMEDGRRTLWFYSDPWIQTFMPAHMPHIATTIALLLLVLCGMTMLWLSALPDLAVVRDSSSGRRHRIYARLAWGWRGTSQQWFMLYHRVGILGAFYFMMLVFVHFLVGVDFVLALVPGWIDSLFPATQAHNAIQAGVATVLIAMFVLHRFGGYKEHIGLDQFWGLGKLMFALSLLWFWFWFSSFNVLWYGAKPGQRLVIELTMAGEYRPVFIAAFLLVFVIPLFTMIWNPLRKSIWGPTIIATGIFIGAALDKIRIYASSYSVSTAADKHELRHLPDGVLPGVPDLLIWLGALGGSVLVYLLASRVFPVVGIWEQKELLLYKVHRPFHRIEVLVLGKPD